jgi:hypothetical protein
MILSRPTGDGPLAALAAIRTQNRPMTAKAYAALTIHASRIVRNPPET